MVRALLVLVIAALAFPACQREITCSSEVTAGEGTFRGSKAGSGPEAPLRRESVRAACDAMCAASGVKDRPGCAAKCAVDAEAGKIGARTTCKESGSR